jgi:flagellin-specific chaperone FliS
LFQLYEFARQKIIKGFSQKDAAGVRQAIEVIREVLDGWKKIPAEERKL